MDVPLEMLDRLVRWFGQSLSPDNATRSAAERSLSAAADAPGFAVALLGLASSPRHEMQDRLAAAIHFNNLVQRRWPRPNADEVGLLPAADREAIKDNILGLLLDLEASSFTVAHLFDALARAAFYDFPSKWEGLLPAILSSLDSAYSAGDLNGTEFLLTIMARLFCRFLDTSESADLHLRADLRYCHEISAAPLQALMDTLASAIHFHEKSSDAAETTLDLCLLRCHGLCGRIFHILNSAEDNILFTEIRLLGTRDAAEDLFNRWVAPFLRLRPEDDKLFEENWMEYIRRDLKGNAMDSLRGPCDAAYKALMQLHFGNRKLLAEVVEARMDQMLASYAADPKKHWKDKDAAVYLATALVPRTDSEETIDMEPVIDLDAFLASVIVPELQAPDSESEPMLKATALRFLHTFSCWMDRESARLVLPSVTRLMKHKSNAVLSYAAIFIEGLLNIKEYNTLPKLGMTTRFKAADINSIAPQMIESLFKALPSHGSHDNPYLMTCMIRVLWTANMPGHFVPEITSHLVGIILGGCDSAYLQHYVFEALVPLIAKAGDQEQDLLPMFEENLFPLLQSILVRDNNSHFWPYALQILAELVKLARPPLSQNYMQLFSVLLSTTAWNRLPCVPALARLLRAILRKIPNELNQEDIGKFCEIFHSLLLCRSSEDSAFHMLNTLVENVGFESMNPHMTKIWTALFARLQTRKATNFVDSVLVFMSVVTAKYGADVLLSLVNANFLTVFLKQFWIPKIKRTKGYPLWKLTAVASTKLLCESPVLLDPAAAELWGRLLNKLVSMMTSNFDRFFYIFRDYDTAVLDSCIRYDEKTEDDLLKEVNDPKQFLATSLGSLCAKFPGRFGPIIQSHLKQYNNDQLHRILRSYNMKIV